MAVGILGGIGFTVSLLIAELAFDEGAGELESAKAAILAASVVSALLAVVALRRRHRAYQAISELEERDEDGDGIPDVYGRADG